MKTVIYNLDPYVTTADARIEANVISVAGRSAGWGDSGNTILN
jgi:hypothetical protein